VSLGTPSLQCFRLDQTFFGFKAEDRVQLHESLFNLVWHGAGRWTWQDLYNMPVYLRRFWIRKLNYMVEEAKQRDETNRKKQSAKSSKVVKSPL
jgi:hypothetical protein